MDGTTPNPLKADLKGPLRCEGAGRLHWGVDPATGERVAIRFVPLDANGAAAVESLTQLPHHPGLPAIRQVEWLEKEAFAVVDFPQGKLLSQLHGAPLDVRGVLALGAELADALAAAHAGGIAHGELSAHSVLMRADGSALLWDLPLVMVDRLSDRRGEARSLQKLEFTAEYLPPERAAGAPPSGEADLWALGALLCRVCGGERPPATSTLSILHLLATEQWRPQPPASLPERLRAVLSAMLSVDASHRPSAREVHDAFSALLARTTTQENGAVITPLVEVRTEPGVRPDPPRSAVPDRSALPTLSDETVGLRNALDRVLEAPKGQALVPWTNTSELPALHPEFDEDRVYATDPNRKVISLEVDPPAPALLPAALPPPATEENPAEFDAIRPRRARTALWAMGISVPLIALAVLAGYLFRPVPQAPTFVALEAPAPAPTPVAAAEPPAAPEPPKEEQTDSLIAPTIAPEPPPARAERPRESRAVTKQNRKRRARTQPADDTDVTASVAALTAPPPPPLPEAKPDPANELKRPRF